MDELKPLMFCGSSLDDLRAFPDDARQGAGYQLDKVQHGFDPDDWKPLKSVGKGVREIRIHDSSGQYRVLYIAKYDDAIYVLHCFEKKTQKTRQADIDLAAQRLRDISAPRR